MLTNQIEIPLPVVHRPCMTRLASSATVALVGLASKAFLNSPCCALTLNGLPILTNALESAARDKGQGILTVANHISTLDDPVIWGILPPHYFFRSRSTRWALGASDIMFTNPFFSTFFRLGQTLETFRGKGIYQPAVDYAIDQLDRGGWVHLYGEGKVNQPDTYPRDETGFAHLPRFKWGVGRMIMDSKIPPVIIPMWLTGFEQLMPEGRSFPYKYLPRLGAQLSITFGNPIPADAIRQALQPHIINNNSSDSDFNSHMNLPSAQPDSGLATRHLEVNQHQQQPKVRFNEELQRTLEQRRGLIQNSHSTTTSDLPRIRARVTAIVHDAVQGLGRSVSGRLLCTPRQK